MSAEFRCERIFINFLSLRRRDGIYLEVLGVRNDVATNYVREENSTTEKHCQLLSPGSAQIFLPNFAVTIFIEKKPTSR